MDNIWAPWRINYITKKKARGCVFCKAKRQKNKDLANYVFLRSKSCFAILNLYPYNNGHAMIVPNRHVKDIESLTQEEIKDLFKTLKNVKKLIRDLLKPHAYNIGINLGPDAGAGNHHRRSGRIHGHRLLSCR